LARRRRELRSSTTSVRRPGSCAVSLTASAARSLTRRRNPDLRPIAVQENEPQAS
jgi:hypothetical protein